MTEMNGNNGMVDRFDASELHYILSEMDFEDDMLALPAIPMPVVDTSPSSSAPVPNPMTTRSRTVTNHGVNGDTPAIMLNGVSSLCCPNTRITVFNGDGSHHKLQMKDHVFIPKDCSHRLADYVVEEPWGKDCGLLYKYLDYIFRCQTFSRQVIEIDERYLIFHSGLQRRCDREFMYVLLVRNKKFGKRNVVQKWRVHYGPIWYSFLGKKELLCKFRDSYFIEKCLPQRTRFCQNVNELFFDDSLPIQVDWAERLRTNKDRLYRLMGDAAFVPDTRRRAHTQTLKLEELANAFGTALCETHKTAQLNPRLAVPQGFVDSSHWKYRMELLLPLNVEFPRQSGMFYPFALAIDRSAKGKDAKDVNKYVAKSILTMDMAYANARLVGYVESAWLRG